MFLTKISQRWTLFLGLGFAILALSMGASPARAFDAKKELAELKILVFDSPRQAIERAEKLEKDVGGSQAGKVWLEIKSLQVLALTKLEKIEEARKMATQALQEGAWIDDRHSKFSLQLTQVDAGTSLGVVSWEKAAPQFDTLIEAIENSGDDPILARALTSYAAAASASGRPLLATGMMQKVMALLPRLEKDEFYYTILNDLVVTYQNVHEGGNLTVILGMAEEVRSFLKERLRRFLGFEIMFNLASAYGGDAENATKALESMQEASRYGEALGDKTVTAYCWMGMSDVLTKAKQYDQAEKYARDALQEFEASNNQVRLPYVLMNLANILLHQSQINEADKILNRLEKEYGAENEGTMSSINFYRTRVLSSRGQYEKASEMIYNHWKIKRERNAKMDADSTQRMLKEFEVSRQEIERINLEEKEGERQLKIEQDLKQSQLKIWVLISIVLISFSLVFDFVRVRRKTTEILNMHRRMREQVLSRFLPPELAQSVARGQANFDEKPREGVVTILFASLDGFKPGTQALPTEQEVELLNEVTELMIQVIYAHGGTVDKSFGGRVMALFGAPISLDPAESARRAILCLKDMQEGFQTVNNTWQTRLQRPLHIRSALHQGKVVIGSFGCARRTDFTALGLAVQVADALEATALGGQCLLSEAMIPYIKGLSTRDLGSQSIKGLLRPMRVSELVFASPQSVRIASAS